MSKRKNTNRQTEERQKIYLKNTEDKSDQNIVYKYSTSLGERRNFRNHSKKNDITDSVDLSTMETERQVDELTFKIVDFDKEVANLYPWILRLAKWYCSSLEDAEDLAGDTICKILDNRNKFQNDRPLKPWCSTVLINTYFTMFKKNSLISFVSYDSAIDMKSVFNPFNNLCYKEVLSAIRRCLKQTKCMDCLLLHVRGYSYEEISLSLDIPIGTVRSRISFSRKMLARELNIRKK